MQNYTFGNWLYFKAKNKINYLKLLDQLCKSQWLSADLIQEYQNDKMQYIFEYAYQHTEYYNNLFKAIGLTNFSNLFKTGDYKYVPILTKEQVRNNLDKLTNQNREDLVLYQTGGSTGIPLKFYANRSFLFEHKWASNVRAYTHAGYRFGDSMGIIWGFDKDIPERTWKQKFVNRVTNNFIELNSFKLENYSIHQFLLKVNKAKVRYIKGYASSLYEVANYILASGFKFSYSVYAVFSEAERLDPFKRARIEDAFKCKVYNYYGSREFGTIAVECKEQNGFHINFEQLFVEVDNNSNILVTSFLNLATPLIRYQIGDCADKIVKEKCRCGRCSERINSIYGRESDNFVSRDGRIIHGEYVTHLFYESVAIKQFQMIQTGFDSFVLKVITDDREKANQELISVFSQMNKQFTYGLNIKVEFVEVIEKTSSGKQKFTIKSF